MVQFQKVLSKLVAQLMVNHCTLADAFTRALKHRAKCKPVMVACTFRTMAKKLRSMNTKSWFRSDLLCATIVVYSLENYLHSILFTVNKHKREI